MCVAPFHCRPKPQICHLKPVTCRPAQVSSRHGPVTNCRPEPPCVVTDIPKRADSYETAKQAFPKIYLNIKMSVFEAKKENILAGFTSKHDRIYVS